MKHAFRDLIIFCIDVLGISSLYRLYYRTKGPLVRVVCFHDVPDKAWFESVIQMFVEEYHLITPQQFHAKEFHRKKINILLTFDDGYLSWIDYCLPVLEQYQVKGLFFVNSGLLDIAADDEKVALFMKERLLIAPKKALTWDGAKKILARGHILGGHTATHPNLALLDKDILWKEIMDDKRTIESRIGQSTSDFAYPFGTSIHFSADTVSSVYAAGYTTQYSALSSFKIDACIPRTLLETGQSMSSVRRFIGGSYDVFSIIKKLWMV